MSKFKKGDKVRIVKGFKTGQFGGLIFQSGYMGRLIGSTGTITTITDTDHIEVLSDGYGTSFEAKWNWPESSLELITQNNQIMTPNKQALIDRAESMQRELDALKLEINKPDVPTYADVVNSIKKKFSFGVHRGDTFEAHDKAGHAYPSEAIARREALRAKLINIAEYVNGSVKDPRYGFYANDEVVDIMYFAYDYPAQMILFSSFDAARLAMTIFGDGDYDKGCELFKSMLIK